MLVPNSLTRIIDKFGNEVKFNFSKVQNAVYKTLKNRQSLSDWEAELRAIKYAELISERIYKKFYDLDYVSNYFQKVINSFDKEEIIPRISKEEFMPRLVILLLLAYLDTESKGYQNLSGSEDKIFSFISKRLSLSLKEEIDSSLLYQTLTQRIIKKSKTPLDLTDLYPSRDYIQDTTEELLKDIGEILLAEDFMIFRQGKKKVAQGEIASCQFTHNGIHQDRKRKTLGWNIEHECDSVFSLNDWVIGKRGKSFRELIELSDMRFHQDIEEVVDKISSRLKNIKVVIIAGPSCSNKTTTTAIIDEKLKAKGVRLKQLNIDDYFFDLTSHPKDEFGDYDYEMPEAIDMELLNQNLLDLVEGKTVSKPHYNFKTGTRDHYSEFKLESDEIILIDCLHGLFKNLTRAIPSDKKFKIYTESSNMIRSIDGAYTIWSDARMAKRMVRDSLFRNHSVQKTLEHWAYVRKGELKHIIPYIYSVDAVLNSGLPYELPVLKSVLKDKLPSYEELEDFRNQPKRLDAYTRGVRLKTLLETVVEFDDFSSISKFSPIREFIGGSGYLLAHNE